MKPKDIEKIIDEKAEEDLLFEEELAGPCWEAKIDKDQLIFLADGTKVLQVKAPENITVELLSYYIQYLKRGQIEELANQFVDSN